MSKDSGMGKVVKDMFREDENSDKFSSKKLMGLVAGFLCFITYVLDMFTIYKANMTLFDSMLIFSASMLGASMVKSFGRNGSSYSTNGSDNQGGYGYGGGGGSGYGYSGGNGYGNNSSGYGAYEGGNYSGSQNNPTTNNVQESVVDENFHNPNYDDSYYDPNNGSSDNNETK